jgi:hypothetical protein
MKTVKNKSFAVGADFCEIPAHGSRCGTPQRKRLKLQ